MKKLILACLTSIIFTHCFAQKNSDSLAYELQRTKINQMLEVRKQKFGQYDESLTQHTGIFGLQTKKDIRRSNDILMDIVKTDDNIFTELKVLMDYRVFQQQQVQTHSAETENINLAYMTTINRLRQQTELLKQEAQNEKEHEGKMLRIFIILAVLMLGSILILLVRKRRIKA